jgi:23S rRNA pseudouridine1911/1915/1917 synthase
MEAFEERILPQDADKRIDSWLAEKAEVSRSIVQAMIAQGNVLCNDLPLKKSGCRLKTGDKIWWRISAPKPLDVLPQNIPLDIIYEDAHLLVVNKPKGMVVHPAPGNPDATLVNALLYHCGASLSGIGGVLRPGIVHRIDKDTSGLLVVAKDDKTHQGLSAQMSVHSIHRVYHAVVYGNLLQDDGYVEAPIGRDPHDRKKMAVTQQHAKYAYTAWHVLERFGNFTYVACQLKTGRTHQIRVHMASIGHPLAGDAVYGPKKVIRSLNGQCLHAKELGFLHPITGQELRFDSPLPPYFENFLTSLRKECEK